MSEQEKHSFTVIDWSADLLGSLTGVSLAVIHNDVAGLLAGAAAGPSVAHALRYGANLFVNRVLSGRERGRVGFVYGLAAHKIKERLDNGEKLRTDGFFVPDVTGRSPADEIAEAVLIAAQREHEERKLPYIANLLAFVAFTLAIDRATANQMIRLAESLSYQQFCLLALGNNPIRASLNQPGYPRGAQSGAPLFAILNELFDLYRNGLVIFQGTIGHITRAPIDARALPLQNLELDLLGQHLYQAMRLGDIPQSDYADIINTLRRN